MEKITSAREISGIRPMNVLGRIVPLCVPYSPSTDFSDEAARRADPRISSLWGRLGLDYLIEEQPAAAVSSNVTVNNFTAELVFRIFAKTNTDRLIERYQPGFVLPEILRTTAERHAQRVQKEQVRSLINTLTFDRLRTEEISNSFRLLFEDKTGGIPLQTVLRTLSTLIRKTTAQGGSATQQQEQIYKRISEVLSEQYSFHPAAKAVSEMPLNAIDGQSAQRIFKLAKLPSDRLGSEVVNMVLSLAESGRTPDEAGKELLREVRVGISGGDSRNPDSEPFSESSVKAAEVGRVLPVVGNPRNIAAALALAAEQVLPEESGNITSQTLLSNSAESRIARAAEQGAERLMERLKQITVQSGGGRYSVLGNKRSAGGLSAVTENPELRKTGGRAESDKRENGGNSLSNASRLTSYARSIVHGIMSGGLYDNVTADKTQSRRSISERQISVTAGTLKRILQHSGAAEEQGMLSAQSVVQSGQAFRETAELLERYAPVLSETSVSAGQDDIGHIPAVRSANTSERSESDYEMSHGIAAAEKNTDIEVRHAESPVEARAQANASAKVVPDKGSAVSPADTVHRASQSQSDDGLFRTVSGKSVSYRDKLDKATLNALDKLIEESRSAARASSAKQNVPQEGDKPQYVESAEEPQTFQPYGSVKPISTERREIPLSGIPQQTENVNPNAPSDGIAQPTGRQYSRTNAADRQITSAVDRAVQAAEQSAAESVNTQLSGSVKPISTERREIPLNGIPQQTENVNPSAPSDGIAQPTGKQYSHMNAADRQITSVVDRAVQTAEQSAAESANAQISGSVKPISTERREIPLSGIPQQTEGEQSVGSAASRSLTESAGHDGNLRRVAIVRDSIVVPTSGHIARIMSRANSQPKPSAVRQAFTFRQSGGADEMVMLVPPKEMDRFTAQNPYMSQLPPVELKEKQKSEQPAEDRRIITSSSPAKVSTSTDISIDKMSREEISRLADKIYERIEGRLARDRHRMGL